MNKYITLIHKSIPTELILQFIIIPFFSMYLFAFGSPLKQETIHKREPHSTASHSLAHNEANKDKRFPLDVKQIYKQSTKFKATRKKGKIQFDQMIFIGGKKLEMIQIEASSTHSDKFSPLLVADGNTHSIWMSKKINAPHWLSIHFQHKRLFNRIVVRPAWIHGEQSISKYEIQFLYKEKWFTFINKEINSEDNYQAIQHDLGGVDAAAVRIYIPEKGTVKGIAAIAEIEIYLGNSRILYLDPRMTNFTMPIPNGIMPTDDHYYPNAPRSYRGGVHAGLDIHKYRDANGKIQPVNYQTPVLAAKTGIIIRADHNYHPIKPAEYQKSLRHWQKNKRTFVLHSYGGRQVWIDHGQGVITAYNHLSNIPEHIIHGYQVQSGELIGRAGNSGLIGEQNKTENGSHLHFEIWIDGDFLGQGLPYSIVRRIYHRLFQDQTNMPQNYQPIFIKSE